MALFAAQIADRNPLVPHSFGFVDGTTCSILCNEEREVQNAYYSGLLFERLNMY